MGLDLDVLDLEPLLSIGLELVLDKLLFLLLPPLLVLDHRLLSLPLFLPPSILLLPTYILPLPMLVVVLALNIYYEHQHHDHESQDLVDHALDLHHLDHLLHQR
jgi:hypothetical protein